MPTFEMIVDKWTNVYTYDSSNPEVGNFHSATSLQIMWYTYPLHCGWKLFNELGTKAKTAVFSTNEQTS